MTLTQTDMNAADPIFRLWDHIDNVQRANMHRYDHALAAKTGSGWVTTNDEYIAGLRQAIILIAHSAWEPKRTGEDFDVDFEIVEAEIDAKLEELRETWEEGQIQKAEIEAERRNEQALYGPW